MGSGAGPVIALRRLQPLDDAKKLIGTNEVNPG
jgi:hypothetical protein